MRKSKCRYDAGFLPDVECRGQICYEKLSGFFPTPSDGTHYFCTYFLTNHKRFFDMKKTVLGILAGAALTLSMASCGDKLLTAEQVQAEVTAGFDAGKAAIETEVNSKCDAEFEVRVQEKVNMLDQAAQAEMAVPSK
jgi:hypothetical protein